jgi:hypothetical protein
MDLALAETQDALQGSIIILAQRQEEIMATREALQQRLKTLEIHGCPRVENSGRESRAVFLS